MKILTGAVLSALALISTAGAEEARVPVSGGTVDLPPFVVADIRPNPASKEKLWKTPWMYASLPGFEILSKCGDEQTAEFAREVVLQQAWLDEIIAPELQARSVVPTTLILFKDDDKEALVRSLAGLVPSGSGADGTQMGSESRLIPQIKFQDSDSTGVELLLAYRPVGGFESTVFQPDYVVDLLARRVPALPPWFVAGVSSLYRDWYSWGDADRASSPVIMSREHISGGGGGLNYMTDDDWKALTLHQLPPVVWLSDQFSHFLSDHPKLWKGLSAQHGDLMMPMEELLTRPPPPRGSDAAKQAWFEATKKKAQNIDKSSWYAQHLSDTPPGQPPAASVAGTSLVFLKAASADSPWRGDVWRSQASLLVRWALSDPTRVRARALWKLAGMASVRPITEAMFTECFGFGFSEAGRELDAYMGDWGGYPVSMTPEVPIDMPDIEPSEAKEAQIARILGDWQRKEVDFVRAHAPQFADAYAAQTMRTLLNAYDDGDHDGDLLDVLGLFECAQGKVQEARACLEAALQGGAIRPQACVALAGIRLQTALERPEGRSGLLSRPQVADILAPIEACRREAPPQLAGCLLAADAWEHADFVPPPGDLGVLDEGVAYFPGNPQVILAAAQIEAAAGLRAQARAILERGLRYVANPRARSLFERLHARYAGP